MILHYNTFIPNPWPCKSVRLNILPPDIDFNIFAVACPTFGFFVSAETAIPIYGLAINMAGYKNLFQDD